MAPVTRLFKKPEPLPNEGLHARSTGRTLD
jgi:hypothetical protein